MAKVRTLAQQAMDAVSQCGGNQVHAADSLGIPRSTLRERYKSALALGLKPSVGGVVADPIEVLSRQVEKLESELRSAKNRVLDDDTVRRRIIGLSESTSTAEVPEWTVTDHGKPSSPGVPTLFCSDWHWGEVVQKSQIGGVNQYSIAIAKDRVRRLVESTLVLLKIIDPGMNYPGLVLPLGGDMISGNIHDELTATNELNTMPTVLDLYGVLSWIIIEMLKHFPKIFLPCVSGNHGRDTHKIWNKDRHHTSFDWLLYNLLAKRFEDDKRVTFLIPDGPDAYYRIYLHRFLLTHGDQFRGGDGMIGALGPITRGDHKKRSRNAQIDMEYDTLMMGHWHQDIFLRRLIVNGSLKGYDEYAYNNNFSFEPPTQQLFITHPTKRITFRMPVLVDQPMKAEKASWVSV